MSSPHCSGQALWLGAWLSRARLVPSAWRSPRYPYRCLAAESDEQRQNGAPKAEKHGECEIASLDADGGDAETRTDTRSCHELNRHAPHRPNAPQSSLA